MSETPHELAHKYVNIYGARQREVSSSFGMSVRDLLHHPTYVKGQCYDVSHDFKRWGEANYPNHSYDVVWGSAPATPNTYPPEFNEHAAVLVDKQHVVDLTRRQFEPHAPVINVMPHKEWRRKHQDLDNPEAEESRVNISKMVRQVAEGQSPEAALVGEHFEHRIPKILEAAMGADDLEKLYGEDFEPGGKVRDFKPIDTGAGVRIRNIQVRKDPDIDPKLPHAQQSRIYVQTTEGNRVLDRAMQAAGGFLKGQGGETPADLLSQEQDTGLVPPPIQDMKPGAIADMMRLRLPENNPHEAWRSGVLPHVFKHLGMTGTGPNGQPHAQWHRKAGCSMCPCSPGFIVHKSDHPLARGHNIWVEVD
jgi:hypothetical protein